jgi:serine/threonine protein kinase
MKIALRILHRLKIIHKDLKPLNFMYSNTYKKNVFIDFGISHPILESFGYLTPTYK